MSDKKLYLNLGCGKALREGFVNIDIQKLPGVDKVQDARDLEDYANKSVDFIVAQRLLCYIPRRDMLPALTEWTRVLKPEGIIEIRELDLSTVTRSLYLNDISKEIGLHHEMVISFLYGKQVNEFDIKYNGFTSEFLQGLLTGIGLEILNVVIEEYDVIITAKKPEVRND